MARTVRLAVAVLVTSLSLTEGSTAEAALQETPPDVPTSPGESPFDPPVRIEAGGAPIDTGTSWGHASPWVVDVDGDGRRDLVVGDFSGLFRFYRNTGTDTAPVYTSAGNLMAGTEEAKVRIY